MSVFHNEQVGVPMSENEQFRSSWLLRSATVVAIQTDGVAVVENGLTLRVLDGRSEHIRFVGDGEESETRSVLAYQLDIYEDDSLEPEESTLHEANIVVTGTLENGALFKLWGCGHAGRDNHGQVECMFPTPPRIELIAADEPFLGTAANNRVGDDARRPR